jgi:hypothetical protein
MQNFGVELVYRDGFFSGWRTPATAIYSSHYMNSQFIRDARAWVILYDRLRLIDNNDFTTEEMQYGQKRQDTRFIRHPDFFPS